VNKKLLILEIRIEAKKLLIWQQVVGVSWINHF